MDVSFLFFFLKEINDMTDTGHVNVITLINRLPDELSTSNNNYSEIYKYIHQKFIESFNIHIRKAF